MKSPNASLVILIQVLVPALYAQDMIGVSWSGTVYALDSSIGSGAAIGSTGQGMGANAMAVDATGTVFVGQRLGTFPNNQWQLLRIDPTTGAGTPIGPQHSVDLRGLAFDAAGILYAIADGRPDQLYTINPRSGAPNPIGATGMSSLQGLTWSGSTLYAWDLGLGLVTIDTTTGAATDVNPSVVGRNMQFLATRFDGALFGGRNGLFAIDSTSGIETLVGSGGYGDLRGCDFVAPACARPYGSGCPGAGGFVPRLAAQGCASAGSSFTLLLDRGPGGTGAVLLFGAGRGGIPTGNGCTLLLHPILPLALGLALGGSGAGNGSASPVFAIPPGLTGARATAQVFLVDLNAPGGFTTTNGLEVIIQ